MLTKVTAKHQCEERSGTYRTESDGQEVWVAFIQLGRHRGDCGEDLYTIVEATAPTEVQAAERCMTKCKLLGDVMTLAIQEGFWGPLRRAELAARNKAFGALGKPSTVIYAEGKDDDGKDEPS